MNLMIVLLGIAMMFIGCLVAGARDLGEYGMKRSLKFLILIGINGLSAENFSNNWTGTDTIT